MPAELERSLTIRLFGTDFSIYRRNTPRAGYVASVAVTLLALLCAAPGLAHNTPIPIALWGNFPPGPARCQRMIGRVAAECGNTTWRLSDACAAAQIDGRTCDMDATRAAISRAHADAMADVEAACTGQNIGLLGYSTMIDLFLDVDIFCQELQDAMVSAVYGPAIERGAITPQDEPAKACILATADASTQLLTFAFRSRLHTLDRIASAPFTPSDKFALIGRSTAGIQRAQGMVAGRLRATCPDFAALYGRNVAPFLTQVTQRADCLSGRTSVQDFVVCPSSICGNGMQEPTERCDDGNTTPGDGCSAECQPES